MARRSVKSPEENVLALRTDSLAPEGTGRQLYDAVYNKQLDQVRTLCERWAGHGEVINWANPYSGDTPLHEARDSPQCATILLSTPGIDVNKGDRHGWTPLWWAAWKGQPETVQALLAAPGIDLNKAPTGGWAKGKSPLTIAREEAARGKASYESEQEAVWRMEGCQEVVRLLEAAVAKQTRPSTDSLAPVPALEGTRDEGFFTPPETPPQRQQAPAPALEETGRQLFKAAAYGEVAEVRTLCERWAGHGEVISWANPVSGSTPLHEAHRSPEITAILLGTPGIDVNKATKHGLTPLFYAAYFGNPKTAKALLAAPGIDINKAATGEGLEGKSPLTIAREMATAGKLWEDSEKEAAERRKACQEVVRLLEAAEAKPSKGGKIKTRKNKRSKKNKRKTSNLYRRRI